MPTARLRADLFRAVTTVAVALCATAGRIVAQTDWRAEASLTRVRPVGSLWTTAGAISVFAQQQVGRFTPILSGAATVAGDTVAAAQVLMGVRVMPPWSDRAPIDVGAMVALYGIAAGDRAQSRALYARQQFVFDRKGVWAGAAIGQIVRAASFASNAFDAGAWLAKGHVRYSAAFTLSSTEDQEIFFGTELTPNPFAPSVRVGDLTLSAEYMGRYFEVDANVGGRVAVTNASGSRGFGSVTVGYHITRTGRVLLGVGNQLADPLRGTPEWKYLSVGLRVGSVPAAPVASRGTLGPAFDATRADNGRVLIHVAAPVGADRIEVIGTLTDWVPLALTRTSDGWEATVSAPAGLHRVQVRVNGGDWRVPSNLAASRDEFGKRAGVIVIP